MVDMKQKELYDWQKTNFGITDTDAMRCALGMSEEVGELCHEILKGTQKIRSGVNGINKTLAADAICDTMIYGIQLMSALGLDVEEELEKTIRVVLKRNWVANPITAIYLQT